MHKAALAMTAFAVAWLVLPAVPRSLLSLAAACWMCWWMVGEWKRTHLGRQQIDDALVLLEMEANEEQR